MTLTRIRGSRAAALLLLAALTGCKHTVTVAPIKIEPIDITLHIYLEADKKLDSFFDYQNQPAPPPAASPAAAPIRTEGAPS